MQTTYLRDLNHKELSNPLPIFDIHFSTKVDFDRGAEKVIEFSIKNKGTEIVLHKPIGYCNAIVYWWRVFLDEENSFSTQSDSKTKWKQMIYYLGPDGFKVEKGDVLKIAAKHDNKKIIFEKPTYL